MIEDDDPRGMVNAPTLTAAKDESDPTGMTVLVTADNHGRGDVFIDFGDLTARVRNPGDKSAVSHQYTQVGTYTISANGVSGGPTGTIQVTVPYVAPPQPMIYAGGDKYKVSATVMNPFLDNVYEAQWVPDGPWQALAGTPPTATHNYPAHAGDVNVTVRYRDHPDLTVAKTVTLPVSKPRIMVFRDLAPDKLTWTITVANPLPGQQYVIQWDSVDFGDSGKGWEPMIGWPPHAHHTYPDAPDWIKYAVNLRYKGEGPQGFTLGVPAPWKHFAPPVQLEAKDSVATVYVAIGFFGHSFEIQWDQDAAWEQMVNVGQQYMPAVSTHTFPPSQTSATVSVRDHAYPALVKTVTLTLPDMETTLIGGTDVHDFAEVFDVVTADSEDDSDGDSDGEGASRDL